MPELNPQDFFDAMMAKFRSKLEELNEKDDDYTARPWDDRTMRFLIMRLGQEIKEWQTSGDADELLDVANFCMFIWLQEMQVQFENNIVDSRGGL